MLAIMQGDEAALRAAAAPGGWPELLAALLFWRYTDASPQLHLAQLVAGATEQMAAAGGPQEPANEEFADFLKELLLLGARLEVQGVVRLATNSPFCGLWLVAHLYDVLRGYARAEAVLARPLPHLGCDQAEMYALHYVETLMGGDGTWQAAAEYLAWCPAHGAAAMEALVARLPVSLGGLGQAWGWASMPARLPFLSTAHLSTSPTHPTQPLPLCLPPHLTAPRTAKFSPDDEVAAHKALALCERHGLASAARALCARLSARASEAGLPGAALRWALRAGDAARAAALATPVVAALSARLRERAAAGAGALEAAPLDLPELDELAPLLDCLPPLRGYDDDVGGAEASGGEPEENELTTFRHKREERAAARRRQRAIALAAGGGGGGGGGARVAYPELQLLRSFAQLQEALRALAAARARAEAAAAAADAAGGARGAPALRAAAAAAGGGGGAGVAAAEAALAAAYRAARRPAMDLLGLPLAPPSLRLPLLRFAVPLLETAHMPFSRADVQRLLHVLQATVAAQSAARAAGAQADDAAAVTAAAGAAAAGGAGAAAGGDADGGAGSARAGEVRLALSRALVRSHILECSAQA